MGATGALAAMGGVSLANGITQGQAQKAQADYTANQYRINSQFAGASAAQTKAAGDIEAGQLAEKGKQEIAEQRVRGAAGGADVNSGSALSLQGDTAWQANQNQIVAKNNAWRTAWGYGVEQINNQGQAGFSELAGENAENASFLTGGMNALKYGVGAYGSYQYYNGGAGDMIVPSDMTLD